VIVRCGDWSLRPLMDVVDLHDSRRIPLNQGERARRRGQYPYYGANGQVDSIDGFIFEGEYVLLAEDGGYFDDPARGVAYEVTGKFWVNNHAHVLSPKRGLSRRFLTYALNAVDWMEFVGGSTRLKLTQEGMRRVRIPVPPPDEQNRMVARLDSALNRSKTAREELDRIPQLVDRYKQAVLAAAFRGELTGSSWAEVSLQDIAKVGTGSTPKRGTPKYYDGGTIPWVTSGAVNDEFIRGCEEYITQVALDETNCKVFPAGTLLVAMYGEGQTRGKVAVLEIAAATNQALAAIQVSRNIMLPEFLLWYLRLNYLALRSQAAGGVQPNLNLGIIKALRIPVPSLSEQAKVVHAITAVLEGAKRAEVEAIHAQTMLLRLKAAILAKAFRDKLTADAIAPSQAHPLEPVRQPMGQFTACSRG
jgi:type I restriction enzyme, S subunit